MRLGDFRKWTADLPDTAEIALWDDGDCTWFEAHDDQIYPMTPIHPFAVVTLKAGQAVELEYDLQIRSGIDDGITSDDS